MGWSGDSDESDEFDWDAHEAKPAPLLDSGAGPSKKGWTDDGDEKPDFGWDTDEGELFPAHDVVSGPSKEVSEAGSRTDWTTHFVTMGFSREMVEKAIQQNRGDTNGILETLLTYGAIEESPKREESLGCSLASDEDELEDDFSDLGDFDFEDLTDDLSGKDKVVSTLVEMGFLAEEASSAIDRCGMLLETVALRT